MKSLALALLAALALPVAADTTVPCPKPIKIGMSYHLARARLIQAGYLPDFSTYPPTMPLSERPSVGSSFIHLGYYEQKDYSNNGNAYMLWTTGKQNLEVTIHSFEEPETAAVVRCSIP